MSTRLVILGLLRERPLYGYEIKSIIEDHMGDWTNIAFGSIYFALGKLADEGYIEKVATEQEGSRPSRSVYQVTPAGSDEFLRLLRQTWMEPERQFFVFDIGLFFMNELPQQDVITFLQQRVNHLRRAMQHIDEHQEEETSRQEVPVVASAIFNHTRVHMQAELSWTLELLEKVQHGAYS